MVKVKIIRHSERLDYKYPLYWILCLGQYWDDAPLTSYGHQLASAKGKQISNCDFNPKNIYMSPYKRTMETSTELKNHFPHCNLVFVPLLSEYQPRHKHSINLYPNGIPTDFDGEETEFIFPENYEQFTKRIKYVVSKLMEKNKEDFIAVTHGEVLKTYINYLQEQYPHLLLDADAVPYLTTLSFEYNPDTQEINQESIKID